MLLYFQCGVAFEQEKLLMLDLPCPLGSIQLLVARTGGTEMPVPSSCPTADGSRGGEAEQHQLMVPFLCELPADLICI